MAIHMAEAETIRAFVLAVKRDRMLALLGNSKRRAAGRDALNHFDGWDPRYIKPLMPTADVLLALRQSGAPAACHVISDDPSLDGHDLPLAEAVAAAERHLFASVLCCRPGSLAFYFDEIASPRRRIKLRRAAIR